MTAALEKNLEQKILAEVAPAGGLEAYTPSLQIQVAVKGRHRLSLNMGETYRYYDLASLTKIIFATSALIKLVDHHRLYVTDRIHQHLPWWPHKKTMVKQVLSHSAGLAAWAPVYKEIRKRKLKSHSQKYKCLQSFLTKQKLSRSPKAVYSDIDFLLLGFLIENGFCRGLHESWLELPIQRALPSMHFCRDNKPKYSRNFYAPTEICPWRKKVLCGEVHDDNTWALGGVSAHAGLFGSIGDLTQYGLYLRKGIFGNTQPLGRPETVQRFAQRAISRHRGDWALGFMMPTLGHASCGRYFSSQSVGHTGFTGTSIWFDPKRDLVVSILSNRVHPTRENKSFVTLRPRLHDLIVETLAL